MERIRALLDYFSCEHRPPHLKEVCQPFCVLATQIADNCDHYGLDKNKTEKALRILLEAKYCAIGAFVSKDFKSN